jgi:hypothetical protein
MKPDATDKSNSSKRKQEALNSTVRQIAKQNDKRIQFVTMQLWQVVESHLPPIHTRLSELSAHFSDYCPQNCNTA